MPHAGLCDALAAAGKHLPAQSSWLESGGQGGLQVNAGSAQSLAQRVSHQKKQPPPPRKSLPPAPRAPPPSHAPRQKKANPPHPRLTSSTLQTSWVSKQEGIMACCSGLMRPMLNMM